MRLETRRGDPPVSFVVSGKGCSSAPLTDKPQSEVYAC
ncbi:MAG: hypothetical protein JWM80_1150 [Cyanobacteria bacterium RYN_339]|nr:hypothetical protein [Cyanobacteria bacterium RYN_339]